MYLVALFLTTAFMAILITMAVNLVWWRRGYHVITRGQLFARLGYTGVILGVIGLMFVGRFLLKWESPKTEVLYWLGLVVIVILVATVVAGDLRSILKVQQEKQIQMYLELVESMRSGFPNKEDEPRSADD